MNLFESFRSAWAPALDRPALVAPGGASWSYDDLDGWSARYASGLADRGVEPGDRVVVQVDKSFANVALYLAVLRLGAVYVPLNPAYTATEVAYFLSSAEPRVLVCRPDRLAELRPVAEAHGVQHVLSLGTEDAAWARGSRSGAEDRSADDLAVIIYTSGTTGRSKGAMLTHGNLIDNARTLHRLWGFTGADVLVHALPIFHVHGLFVALHTSWLSAIPVRFLPRFDAAEVREQLPGATVLMGVPTFYVRLAAQPGFGAEDCRTMRLFVSGSAPLTEATSDAWAERTGHRILERYGMSEAGMIASNPLDGDRVAGTVGYPVPGYRVRVADAEGRALPAGEVGVLEIAGPSLFRGYWRMPAQTAEAFRDDGFFVTGDLARIAADGRITLVGRARDLIISGGYNLYPKEIERVLDDVPGVSESAVVGIGDPDLGEIAVGVLVAEDAPVPDEIVFQALAGALARYKQPRRLVWVEALPRNAMGKVQKAALREQLRG